MDKDVMSRAEAAFVLMKMMRRGGVQSARSRRCRLASAVWSSVIATA